ncbi:MAG: ATP synthase F1 subunit delta [Sulfobacillus sp.]
MMMTERVARPYARALFELAQAASNQAQIAHDLRHVLETIEKSPDLKLFLWHPQVSHQAKAEVIGRVFTSEVSTLIIHFLLVVAAKGREIALPRIYEEYQKLWDAAKGRLHAHVQSAVALTDSEEAEMSRVLSAVTGKTVELAVAVTPSLLGGVVVRIGDRVMDGSLARRLSVLGERLRNGSGGGYVVEH